MNRKFNPIIAVGAVLLLVGVAVLAVLAGRGNSSSPDKVKALVATADVAAGTPVASAALQVQDVNAKDAPPGSPTSITAIAGTFATTKILKGQVITGASFGQVASTTSAGISLPKGKEEEYRAQAEKFARKTKEQGALGTVEALGDNLQHGHTTDFFRAVQATDDENVVFSFILWPDKDVRDRAWEKLMADPEMQPGAQPMPFDGKRMFWGGFNPVLNTLQEVTEAA